MKAQYYKKEQVLHLFSPLDRFLSKYLPKEWFVIKCKDCKQIPTELISGYCLDCFPKPKQR